MDRILERITDAQKSQYDREGYLLVPHLISADLLDNAETALQRVIGKHSNFITLSEHHRRLLTPAEEPEVIAIFNLQFRVIAAQLAGEDPDTFTVPRQPWAIIVFPYGTDWQWPDPHIDHALKEDNFRIFPAPFRIASISYLSDVQPHAGGTVVWPGSHKILGDFVKKNRKQYRYMSDLNPDLHKIPLNSPVELLPRRGDVLFYHSLCAHEAGMNVSHTPRLAVGKKW